MGLFGKRRRGGRPHPAPGPDPALDDLKVLVGTSLARQVRAGGALPDLRAAEFKVFSQFGDDGICQYLLGRVGETPDRFVEFGVGDYMESNTRFLLQGCAWRGLVMDSGEAEMASLRARDLYWRHDLTAVQAFVDRDNVDDLIASNGFGGPLGLLSVDIDGNDYWVWDALTVVDPVLAVVEYNSVFGPTRAVTVPYEPRFDRTAAHPSNLYWGASLAALCRVAGRKGMAFVGSNAAGNNAWFVRRDRLGGLRALAPEEGWVDARFRESRDAEGRLTYLAGPARRAAIAGMPVFDVDRGETVRVQDL